MINRTTVKTWFIHDGRLRSGWRITSYVIASFFSLVIFAQLFGVTIALTWASRGISFEGIQSLFTDFAATPFNYPDVALGFMIVRAAITLGVIWIFRRRIDQRPFRDLGFQMPKGWLRELGAGFTYAGIGWLMIFVLALVFGAATIVDFEWNARNFWAVLGALFIALIFNFLVGIAEEADARGYVLQNMAEGIRLVPAILASSFYFGAAHLFNPGGGVGSTLGIFVAGILLAMGYYLTGRLWFSIGLHAGWNFAEGPIFGFVVSGLNMGGLFQLKINGPDWLMGGAFGPEAGALAVVVEIAMIAFLVAWKQGRFNGVKEFFAVFFAGWR